MPQIRCTICRQWSSLAFLSNDSRYGPTWEGKKKLNKSRQSGLNKNKTEVLILYVSKSNTKIGRKVCTVKQESRPTIDDEEIQGNN